MIEFNTIYNEDCLVGMADIPDESVDMILCDLPYGTTRNKWDTIIPLDELWAHYERVIKDNGAIVLTAAQPFTSTLITSNKKLFRYSWVWDKKLSSGFLNAKRMPLKRHEDIVVFYKKLPSYNPIMETRGKKRLKGISTDSGKHTSNYGEYKSTSSVNNEYYPTSILEIPNTDRRNSVHPTQKPVPLFEYLIESYTNEGETILDNCMGSGTTAIAAINTGRNYIGYELDPDYHGIAEERIAKHVADTNEKEAIE